MWLVLLSMIFPVAVAAGDVQRAAELFLTAHALADEGRIAEALAALDEAEALSPDDPYLLLERALLLARAGRLSEAAEAVAKARSVAPSEPEILRQQGRIAMSRLGEDEQAAETARRAFEELRRIDADDLEMLVALGQLYLAGGRPALAEEVLEEAHRQRPDHPWIQSLRARARDASGASGEVDRLDLDALQRDPNDLRLRFELAVRMSRVGEHRRAADLLESAPAHQRRETQLRFRIARQRFLAGDVERAREVAAGLASEQPDAAPVRFLLARTEIALGLFAEAELTLAADAARAADDPLVAELLLRALEGQEKTREAAAVLQARREALERSGDVDSVETTALELARLWGAAGQWSNAESAARPVLASEKPERAEAALRAVVRALAARGATDEAMKLAAAHGGEEADLLRLEILLATEQLEPALALANRMSERRPPGDLAVAGLLQDAGAFEAALPKLQAARSHRRDSLEAWFRLASCLERLGRREEAVGEFRGLLAEQPDFAPALNYLGYLWIEKAENLEQAVGMVERAVRLDPDNGAYVDSLGWGLFQLGRLAESARMLERAARLLPRDPTVLEHLGDARAATGDVAGAREAYGRALAAGATSVEALDVKRRNLGGDS